jgi:uncharacterized membrane protein YkoI
MKIRAFGSAVAAAALITFGASSANAQSLEAVIEAAQAQIGGEVYDASRIGRFAEVELLSGNRLIDAIFDFDSGQLIDSEVYGSARLASRVERALDRADLTLIEAIDAAEEAVGPGEVLEAELRVAGRQGGRQFIVDIRTSEGIFDVIVDASSGRIIRIIRD